MKTLQNQTLFYDEDCPLCQTYTTAFIHYKMLEDHGRKPYSEIHTPEFDFVNRNRAANEIALVNHETKTVVYGIDSILKVIGNSFPWMEKVGHWKPVYGFLTSLYRFISYNRKVILLIKENKAVKLRCEPSFNIPYRVAYLLFGILLTTLVLFQCSKMITAFPESNYSRELLLASGQLVFQSLFFMHKSSKTLLVYWGNLMTVSLYGCLLLLPIIVVHQWIDIPQNIVLIWFSMTVILLFVEHFRRVKILELPTYLCATWIAYRLIALYLILKP